MDYKESLSLPRTDFPMKANLPVREPLILEKWKEIDIYAKIIEKTRQGKKFVLHDGPPYANGHIHMGHALNKILKDIIVKYRSMTGNWSEYVPGWDCHGLPIEHQVDKNLGEKKYTIDRVKKRQICRDYAAKFLDIQREEFKRLGIFGDWDNPYKTMSFDYEAKTLRELGAFVRSGAVYRGVKPVYWCKECKTALAEAEVEYHDHSSPSIYVKFPYQGQPGDISSKLSDEKVFFVIWTTTPWTIPSNLAIALHPELEYAAIRAGNEVYVVAAGLIESFVREVGIEDYERIDTFKAGRLERLLCHHPLYDRESLLVLGDYVTLEAGTGCVHTAPGHGREDYETGLAYSLDIYAPVDDGGRFTTDVEHFAGMDVFDADSAVIDKLRERGMLVGSGTMSHAYPHCWRCKEPVIFRATSQWFISMEATNIRKKALGEIEKVTWIPRWGQQRIASMIETRPDWCISRQRAWGVPITAFTCTGCKRSILSDDLVEKVARVFDREGADAWFTKSAKELVGDFACPDCGCADLEKEMDILDVWFDSGVSYAAVCEGKDNLGIPVDLYLEGSDQHRGWFHSTLLASAGTRGFAPYRAVLTHGFVVDGQGKKMSKSLGNYMAPGEIISRYGAEILRLWVIAEDYRDDIRISEEILERTSDAYRKIRNTIRFLTANLFDFEPAAHAVAFDGMLEIDRFALSCLNRLIERTKRAYENYEFHLIYHSVHNFCVVDMSSFYLDVIKDRLYASRTGETERRSAQTAIYLTLKTLLTITAPVISFTAEESWNHAPDWDRKPESVFLESFPEPFSVPGESAVREKFEKILKIREDASRALEAGRQKKIIGHSLDAVVSFEAPGETGRFISDNIDLLRDVLIVSMVEVVKDAGEGAAAGEANPDLRIAISKSRAKKCERCWKYEETVGKYDDHPTICERCRNVIG
ncbi:MAG: isoleucine--tRNA ligase [Deltaproteobacteria bacterium]|nr:isoleucine--tRNA ligase [Deltaproteobacteria bacterium]NIS76175.1 isoleucine--tRNA ligase [Deltaproteobacteria bacterium]